MGVVVSECVVGVVVSACCVRCVSNCVVGVVVVSVLCASMSWDRTISSVGMVVSNVVG